MALLIHYPRRKAFHWLPLWLPLLVVILQGAESPPASRSLEHKVKAAYLFNFAKYVEWPPKAFANSEAPLALGVLGKDPFGPLLEETIAGRRVGSRPVTVSRSMRIEDLKHCHILFISSSEESRLEQILADLKESFTLTVSDIPQFYLHGGMVGFILENEVVRFDIDLDNAEQAGLKISARMLATARVVHSKNRNRSR